MLLHKLPFEARTLNCKGITLFTNKKSKPTKIERICRNKMEEFINSSSPTKWMVKRKTKSQ